jgi:hypothetical protein
MLKRPWRWLAAVAAGIVLVAAAAIAVAAQDRGPTRLLPPPDQRVAPPGERLVPLVMFKATGERPGEAPPAVKLPLIEVLPDGAVAEVFTPADDVLLGGVWPRGDGRLVIIGAREGGEYPLMVIGADGRVASEQDVGAKGERVNPIGVTGNEAILQRSSPRRIVARDLSTGEDRDLGAHDRTVSRGDAEGDRLVLAGGGIDDSGTVDTTTRCRVELFVPGAGVANEVSVPGCHQVVDVNASPDGRFAAMVYQRWHTPEELRMVTIDLDAMRVVTDELLGNPVDCTGCLVSHSGYVGMAWQDNRKLRVVFMDPLPLDLEPDEILGAVEERLRTQFRTMLSG